MPVRWCGPFGSLLPLAPLLLGGADARFLLSVRGEATSLASGTQGTGPGAGAVVHLAPELSGYKDAQPVPAITPGQHLHLKGHRRWSHAFIKAFFVVSVAELFDKTWFMTLILALKMGWRTALAGGFTGLALHCVLSALLGFGFSKLLRPSVLHFVTAGLFFLFTLLYAKDWYFAEAGSDVIAAGKTEAAEAVGDESPEGPGAQGEKKAEKGVWKGLAQSFIAVFIAEWGDRTQMAMIGLHSSLPVIPVFVGSALAFLALSVSAVVVASCIAKASLSEKLVMGTASISFLVFAVLALVDGLKAKSHGE